MIALSPGWQIVAWWLMGVAVVVVWNIAKWCVKRRGNR